MGWGYRILSGMLITWDRLAVLGHKMGNFINWGGTALRGIIGMSITGSKTSIRDSKRVTL
jgi:hypothetical protein